MALLGKTPLFQIDAILSAPKIVSQPQSNEIYWVIMQSIRDCIECTKVRSSQFLSYFIKMKIIFFSNCGHMSMLSGFHGG